MLTNQQLSRLMGWFKDKISSNSCPVCRKRNSMEIGKGLVSPLPQQTDQDKEPKPGFPLAWRHCKNCGYVQFFSAITIGLTD